MPNALIASPTDTIEVTDTEGQIGEAIAAVVRTGNRVVVAQDGVPVAAIVSMADAERLDRYDAEWTEDFAVFSEIGAAFADVDPEEIEREAARALAEVRAEMRVERAAGIVH